MPEFKVVLTNDGAIDKAIKRVKAAQSELNEAAEELALACGGTRVVVKEAASATNTDG